MITTNRKHALSVHVKKKYEVVVRKRNLVHVACVSPMVISTTPSPPRCCSQVLSSLMRTCTLTPSPSLLFLLALSASAHGATHVAINALTSAKALLMSQQPANQRALFLTCSSLGVALTQVRVCVRAWQGNVTRVILGVRLPHHEAFHHVSFRCHQAACLRG